MIEEEQSKERIDDELEVINKEVEKELKVTTERSSEENPKHPNSQR